MTTQHELISIYKNGVSARGHINDMVKFVVHDMRRGNPAIGVTSDGAFIHESCSGEWAKRYINEAKEMGREGCTWRALLDLLWDQEDLLTHERCLELALSLCEPADSECKNAAESRGAQEEYNKLSSEVRELLPLSEFKKHHKAHAQATADRIRREYERAAEEKKKIARPTIAEMESENTSFRHHSNLGQWAYLYFDANTTRGCLPDGTRVFCRRDGGYIKSIAGGNSRHCRWLLCESKHVCSQKELRDFLKCHTEKPQNAKEDSGAIMAAIALELADREQVPEALSEIVIDAIQIPDDLPDLIDCDDGECEMTEEVRVVYDLAEAVRGLSLKATKALTNHARRELFSAFLGAGDDSPLRSAASCGLGITGLLSFVRKCKDQSLSF